MWNFWKPFTYWHVSSEENSFRDLTIKKLNDDFYQYKYIYVFCGKSERESWAKLPEPEMRSEGLWESLMTSLLLSLISLQTVCDPVNSVHHQKRSLLKGVAMRDWSSFRQTILSFSDAALVTSILCIIWYIFYIFSPYFNFLDIMS